MRGDDKNVLAKEFFIYNSQKGRKGRRDRRRTGFENPVHNMEL